MFNSGCTDYKIQMIVDVDIFDQVISNMDTPEKVVSRLSTAVQSLLGRKLFGVLFSVIQSHQCSEKATEYGTLSWRRRRA